MPDKPHRLVTHGRFPPEAARSRHQHIQPDPPLNSLHIFLQSAMLWAIFSHRPARPHVRYPVRPPAHLQAQRPRQPHRHRPPARDHTPRRPPRRSRGRHRDLRGQPPHHYHGRHRQPGTHRHHRVRCTPPRSPPPTPPACACSIPPARPTPPGRKSAGSRPWRSASRGSPRPPRVRWKSAKQCGAVTTWIIPPASPSCAGRWRTRWTRSGGTGNARTPPAGRAGGPVAAQARTGRNTGWRAKPHAPIRNAGRHASGRVCPAGASPSGWPAKPHAT